VVDRHQGRIAALALPPFDRFHIRAAALAARRAAARGGPTAAMSNGAVRKLRFLCSHVWALPATAIGLSLALPVCAAGASVRVVDGVIEVAGGRLMRALARAPSCAGFNAITLGHVVIGVSRPALDRCRAHERVHVRQYERWGLLFFVLYAASSLAQWLHGRSPYWDNRFERDARRRR
jgi:hypothetical protein